MSDRRYESLPPPAIEPMTLTDWESVRAIYREGIATGHATFEADVPEGETWDRGRLVDARPVARADGQVVGWAALSPVSSRPAYAGVAEVSLFVTASARGRGVGKALLRASIEASERASGHSRGRSSRRTPPASPLSRGAGSGRWDAGSGSAV